MRLLGLIQYQDYVNGFDVIIHSNPHTQCISFAGFEREPLLSVAPALLPFSVRSYVVVWCDFTHNPSALPNIDLDARRVGDGRLGSHRDQGLAASLTIYAELGLDCRLPLSEQVEFPNRHHRTHDGDCQEGSSETPTD